MIHLGLLVMPVLMSPDPDSISTYREDETMLNDLTSNYTRYYVMYDYSIDAATVNRNSNVHDAFTFLVASFNSKEDAISLQDAINHNLLDIMSRPGPWRNICPEFEDDYDLPEDSVDYRHY